MSKRISKRVREEAALICAIAASTPDAWNYYNVQHHLGVSRKAASLAFEAWRAVYSQRHRFAYDTIDKMDSEAAQLLEDGWSPGDSL